MTEYFILTFSRGATGLIKYGACLNLHSANEI